MIFPNSLSAQLGCASGTLRPGSLCTMHNPVLQGAHLLPSSRPCTLLPVWDRTTCITAIAAATEPSADVQDQNPAKAQQLAAPDGRRTTKSRSSSNSSSSRSSSSTSGSSRSSSSSRSGSSQSGSSSSAQRGTVPRAQPFLIRIAGRSSDIKGASGAIVKRLRSEDQVRVAAIDEGSIFKAMLTLTAANIMSQANNGQMLVFQPTVIGQQAAEPPRLPEGSMVMYTAQIMQGEVMTFNTLKVSASTQLMPLARAIIARMLGQSHTVLECYGQAALVQSIQAVAQARKGLLVRGQDVACIISSTAKAAVSTDTSAGDAAETGPTSSSSSSIPQPGDEGATQSRRPPLCHRLVLLECEPRNPRALLVRATMGVTDRTSPFSKQSLTQQQSQS